MNLENKIFYRFIAFSRITLITLALISAILFILWNLTPDYFQNSKVFYPIISAITGYKIDEENGIKFYPIPALSPENAEYDYMDRINKDATSMTPEENKKMAAIGLETKLELAITSIISFLILYMALNIFFEGLLYVAFQKKPSWRWILFFTKTLR